MIKTVVFDMDGVLIDAREWHFSALNRALELFGYSVSRYDHLVTYDGLPTRRKLEMLSRERHLPRQLHGFIHEMKQQYTTDMVLAECRPTFQHRRALAELRHRGYLIAVASNAIRASVEMMMDRAGLSEFVQLILSNEDVTHPKPDPEIYLKVMDQLGATPETTLVLEDNQHGIDAAVGSGAHVMAIADPRDVRLEAILDRIGQIESMGTRR